jgi:hypothetical protein
MIGAATHRSTTIVLANSNSHEDIQLRVQGCGRVASGMSDEVLQG